MGMGQVPCPEGPFYLKCRAQLEPQSKAERKGVLERARMGMQERCKGCNWRRTAMQLGPGTSFWEVGEENFSAGDGTTQRGWMGGCEMMQREVQPGRGWEEGLERRWGARVGS